MPEFTDLMGNKAVRLFAGMDSRFRDFYYSFKCHRSDTCFLLNFPPQETYPEALRHMRAEWTVVREGKTLDDHLEMFRKDHESFLAKAAAFGIRYLLRETNLREYVAGDSFRWVAGAQIPRELRSEHLRYIAELLRKFPNIEVGITKDSSDLFYCVNDAGVILLSRGEHEGSLWAVAMSGTASVAPFRENFESLWNMAVTDRGQVLAHLEHFAKYVPSSV